MGMSYQDYHELVWFGLQFLVNPAGRLNVLENFKLILNFAWAKQSKTRKNCSDVLDDDDDDGDDLRRSLKSSLTLFMNEIHEIMKFLWFECQDRKDYVTIWWRLGGQP